MLDSILFSARCFSHLSDHLIIAFQILERALQECGNDLDAAIHRLHELCLGSAEDNSGCAEESDAIVEKGILCAPICTGFH